MATSKSRGLAPLTPEQFALVKQIVAKQAQQRAGLNRGLRRGRRLSPVEPGKHLRAVR